MVSAVKWVFYALFGTMFMIKLFGRADKASGYFYMKYSQTRLWGIYQRDLLLWLDSNNYSFLEVTLKQNAFLWVTFSQKHLSVSDFVTFNFFRG